jgi:hypothetical protein
VLAHHADRVVERCVGGDPATVPWASSPYVEWSAGRVVLIRLCQDAGFTACGDRSAARRRALRTSSLGSSGRAQDRGARRSHRGCAATEASDRARPRSQTDSQTRQRNNVRDDRGSPGWRRTACCSRGGVLGGPGWTRVEILDVPAAGPGPVLRPAAIRRPATRTIETVASPILRGLLVGDPVGMLSCDHVEELDQTAAEPRGQPFKPQAQRALASDAGIPEPVLDVPGIVLFDVVAALRVGADVLNRGVAVNRAPTRGGSTV